MVRRLRIWRIEKEIFAATARSGEGARIAGGRWNSPGVPAIYCGQSLALSLLEILVHAATPDERVDPRVWFEITLPEFACRTVVAAGLPLGWDDPIVHPQTVAIGDVWLRTARTIALRVPSAIVPGEWDVILNPRHAQFRRLVRWSKPAPLRLDPRLVE